MTPGPPGKSLGTAALLVADGFVYDRDGDTGHPARSDILNMFGGSSA